MKKHYVDVILMRFGWLDCLCIGPKFQCRESWSRGNWPPEFGTRPFFWLRTLPRYHDCNWKLEIENWKLEIFTYIPPLSPRIWKNLDGYKLYIYTYYTYIVENEPANNDGGNAGSSQPRRVSGFGMINAGLTRHRRVTWDLCLYVFSYVTSDLHIFSRRNL